MKTEFLNDPDDVLWIKSTALRGVILPTEWAGFSSFILQGNEDAPYAVNLYASQSPNFDDDYYRVLFDCAPPVYCQACEYDGKTDRPKGGLSELKQ